ncbi:ATP-binding protein [Iamia sp. SCSIO 61187]|uniref:ATP-binding protein n=1 Tax=Iamia sp. SCSIO 61187 TaxID=2722752 RepID=UPI001C6279EA|nr:ATP-binding protein [Iamia sp. SCSIO 61187]QYG92481.1 ATP-binding protein [Iamia sp. SCSIO 61187]
MSDVDLPPIEIEVPAELGSLGDLRAIVVGFARRVGFRDQFDVEVVASELVTNAIVHAGTAPIVTLTQVGHRRMEIAVADEDPRSPGPVDPYENGTRGHGLAIVATLSRTWGVRREGGSGKTVWAEVEEQRPLRLVDGCGPGAQAARPLGPRADPLRRA